MRRIVVIAAGMSGLSCAARIKHALPDCELNVVTPVPPVAPASGPAGERHAAELPDPEFLIAREIAILEAQNIMPDLARQELVLGSSRGNLSIRYTDIVIEVPATVRIPRALQQAENIFPWPASGFAANTEALDAALSTAGERKLPVVVTGNGPAALEAVFLVREAGLQAIWLRTEEKGAPAVDPHLLALILKRLGSEVVCIPLPELASAQLVCRLDSAGKHLEHISWPGGDAEVACCLWTSPLMARHPLLREDGVVLDAFGRIEAMEGAAAGLGLHLIGSGAAVPPALLANGSATAPAYPGSREAARLSASLAVARLRDPERICRESFQGALGAHGASSDGLEFHMAGLGAAEAQALGLDADLAVVSASLGGNPSEVSRLVLTLVADKKSRALLGLQVLGLGAHAAAAKGVLGLGLAALADGTSLETLMQRQWSGLPARLLGQAAFILANKFDTVIQGISPDEFLASRNAGAEFFTLDLRLPAQWEAGRLPGAYNIPLAQLKKRLQDEVPRFTPLVLVCATGDEAHAAAVRLASLGATDLYVLDGGMDVWPYSLDK